MSTYGIESKLLTLASSMLLLGCGEVIEGEGIESITLEAPEGATVSAGASTAISVSAQPLEKAAGVTIELSASGGTLIAGEASGASIELTAAADGTFPEVRLAVAIDAASGAEVVLTSSTAALEGSDTLAVVDPELQTVSVDSDDYSLANGYQIEAIKLNEDDTSLLLGRAARFAFPPPNSGFEPGIYLGVGGDIPSILRLADDGKLEIVATSDGINGPDENIVQMAFSEPAGPYGDNIYICSASAGGGDGLFRVSAAGTFSQFDGFNNCNGMVFDESLVVGNPGFSPLYVNRGGANLERYDAEVKLEGLRDDLPVGCCGNKLFIKKASSSFPSGMYLLFGGEDFPDQEGLLQHLDDAGLQDAKPTINKDSLGAPQALVFGDGTPFGDLAYIAEVLAGELRAYRADGTGFVFMSGLIGLLDIAMDPDGKTLWVFQGDRGRLMKITRDSTLAQ